MISWAITACNEHVELKRLLDQIESIKKDTDEIVILLDTTFTPEVKEIAAEYNPWITPLNGDFAAFKNILKDHCLCDNICFLDADELLSNTLALTIHELINLNPSVDCWALPRINTVEGIGVFNINEWKWNISKLNNHIEEKILDLDKLEDLNQYNLLKQYNLIIEELNLE
jgi:hypothetical protein